MSRLTIPKIPFRPLTMITQGYLFHSRLTSRGTLPKSHIFPLPQVSSIWFILFPLIGATWITLGQKFQDNPNLTKALSFDRNFPSLGQPEPFQAKKSQDSPNLIKTLSFDRNITWIISNPKESVKTVHFIATYQVSVPLQLGFLKKNEKMEKELWSFHHAFGIFKWIQTREIPIKETRNLKLLKKEKIWSD